MLIERRNNPQRVWIETRADGSMVVAGYASVFYHGGDPGTQYSLEADVVERVSPSAFDRAIAQQQDVACRFNHMPTWQLGKTSDGSCRLSVDAVGLRYECDLKDSAQARSVTSKIERGEVAGSSFSFVVASGGTRWTQERDVFVRWLVDVDLRDVAPVEHPAYPATRPPELKLPPALRLARQRQRDADEIEVAMAWLKITA
jgi:HK97 family phage prohead protease